jgi:ribosome modulation factor
MGMNHARFRADCYRPIQSAGSIPSRKQSNRSEPFATGTAHVRGQTNVGNFQMDASTGHNSNELTPGERKALFMDHMRKISAQQAVCDRENEERKRLRKVAKTDGILLADIDYGLRILKVEEPDIIVSELKRRAEIANWFALPVGTQSAMFDEFEREPAADRAFREGMVAGSLGKDCNPPYGSPSAVYDSWKDGWRQAQEGMAKDLQAAMEKKNADIKKKEEEQVTDEIGPAKGNA